MEGVELNPFLSSGHRDSRKWAVKNYQALRVLFKS